MRWLPIDIVLVVLFAVAGRASHDEGLTVAGIAHTAWPFLVGLLVGWALVLVLRRAPGSLTSGVILWLSTLVGGMLLRVVSDAGTATAFVVVATLVTGALLIGSRLVARLVPAGR